MNYKVLSTLVILVSLIISSITWELINFPNMTTSSIRLFDNVDILNNPIDAIGSVANFLNKKGKWKPNVPIAMRARAISEIKEITSSFKPYMTEIELEKFGLEATKIIPSNLKFVPISLNLEDGYEYWLGFDNYQSISRYNRSKLYVMAVFEFSNSLSKFL